MPRLTERIGKSGEYSVCAWLSIHSDLVALIPHSSHTDIVFEYEDFVIRCQVKTCTKEKKYISRHTGRHYRSGWCWDIRKGSHTKDREYKKNQVDLYALYCKPLDLIVWITAKDLGSKKKITFRSSDLEKYDSFKEWMISCEQVVNSSQKA